MSDTTSEAAKLRDAGVTVFSIGVGSGANEQELKAMATDPDVTHVFTVTNFTSLYNITGPLAQETCQGKMSHTATFNFYKGHPISNQPTILQIINICFFFLL